MKAITNPVIKSYQKHIREVHLRENEDPRFITLSESDLDHAIEKDVKIATAYYKEYGHLSHTMGMRLWWALMGRKPTDFALTDIEKHWLNKVVSGMTDEQIEKLDFPNPDTGRLLYLIACLKDTGSVKGIELQQDAYDYIMDNCPLFEKRANELCDKALAKSSR